MIKLSYVNTWRSPFFRIEYTYYSTSAGIRSRHSVVESALDFESGGPGFNPRGVLRHYTISLANALYDDWPTTLCLIVSRLPPLIHVDRLSVTCRDGLRAPVLWQGMSASSFLFLLRFQNAFYVFKILFLIHILLNWNYIIKNVL